VEACTKVVAAGGAYDKMRFSYQEYFERMTSDPRSWGKPMSALLGALKMQYELGLPSIGGKDSMSGTFEDINVPPTLIAFGITTVNANHVISPELKWEGNKLYLIRHTPHTNLMPDTDQLKANWTYVNEQIKAGNIVSAYSIGYGGVAEAICKMAFGNAFGVKVKVSEEDLFNFNYGSILVESDQPLDFPQAELIGEVTDGEDGKLHINDAHISIFELMDFNSNAFNKIYPDKCKAAHKKTVPAGMEGVKPFKAKKEDLKYKGEKVEKPIAYLPVFPGTNCDYDTAKAFRKAGAEVRMVPFCNLTTEAIFASIEQMKKNISECHILALCGGFSAGDEPDGSGKFIANVLNNKEVAEEIHKLIDRGGLILGICNGFQALVKSGLLPYGRLGMVTKESPTLFRNDINRHISQMVTTRISTVNSPWLAGMNIGDLHTIAVSHGEGKFVVSEEFAKELFANGQVAFQYVDPISEEVTMESPYNPNGSYYAIEGIISKNGQIIGKMGHTERYENNVFKNIEEELEQPIFANAVKYFRGE
jgi:phosphoribosylformylglycinamidine synthase